MGVLLAAYAHGMDSQRYTGMDDESVISEMVYGLATVFNTSETFIRNKLIDYVIKRWGTDPFQLGSYASLFPNQVLQL